MLSAQPLHVRLCASALLLYVVAACSKTVPEGAWQDAGAPSKVAQDVSAEQLRAAKALSLGDRQTLEDAGSPYKRALVCRDAIDAVIDRLKGGLASEQQLALLAQARAIYDGRLRAVGPSTQLQTSESEGDPNAGAAADSASVLRSQAQLVLACLQQMQ